MFQLAYKPSQSCAQHELYGLEISISWQLALSTPTHKRTRPLSQQLHVTQLNVTSIPYNTIISFIKPSYYQSSSLRIPNVYRSLAYRNSNYIRYYAYCFRNIMSFTFKQSSHFGAKAACVISCEYLLLYSIAQLLLEWGGQSAIL